MKGGEITRAVRRFGKAVAAYEELVRALEQARRSVAEAAPRYPALARAERLFEQAARSLEVIGAAVADVPGLAGELEEEQQRLARLRALAERHGIEIRYDVGFTGSETPEW
jgi:ABC-type transporter Mla subunit MlaD